MTGNESRQHKPGNELARALARWDNEGGALVSGAGAPATLGEVEVKILQCLGAALLVQWNDIPTDIQRKLFRHAVSMGEPQDAGDLKGEIARFLHNHKDDESENAAKSD